MRTTITIDDALFAEATELTGVREKSAIMRLGLETLIRVESAKRLALLGGSQPELEDVHRRRSV